MKRCIDCEHFSRQYTGNYSPAKLVCLNRALAVIDPVDGEAIFGNPRVLREPDGKCGPEAEKFEPKKPTMRPQRPAGFFQRLFGGAVGA